MSMLGKIRPGWGILPVVIFLAVWEAGSRLNLIPGQLFFPSFSMVMQEFYHLIAGGILVDNFLASLFRVVIGFLTGSIAGLAMGILMG